MNRRNLLIFSLLVFATTATPLSAATIESDGVPIHYVVMGEGDPVVLLHGLMVDWKFNFGELASDLSEDFQVIAVDLRGHGKSGKPESPTGYGPTYLDDVLAVMNAVDVESAHVVGYSLGGYIALKFAASFPEKTRSLVLAGSGYQTQEWFSQSSEKLRNRFAAADTVARGFTDKPEDLPAGYRDMMNRNDKQAMMAALGGLEALVVDKTRLEQLDMPIQGIFGGKDYGVPNMLAPIQVAQPDMSVVIIPDATHLTAINSERFRSGIADFLRKHAE